MGWIQSGSCLKYAVVLSVVFTTVCPGKGRTYRQDDYYGIGPSLGYSFSRDLGGPTVGFDAAWVYHQISWAMGVRYIWCRDSEAAFGPNSGLATVYAEVVTAISMAVPIGGGISYNFLLGNRSGPGAHLFFFVPWGMRPTGYMLLFYRPGWVWLDRQAEVIHEVGLYFKFSNLLSGK